MKCINFVGNYQLPNLKRVLQYVVVVEILEDDCGYYLICEESDFQKIKLICLEENIKIMISHNRDALAKCMLKYCNYPTTEVKHISDLIFENKENEKIKNLVKLLFSKVDEYLIYTVEAYMNNSLNLLKTAKEIFVHRNTLNYRITQFIEITGVDIKDFKNMLLFYFYKNI